MGLEVNEERTNYMLSSLRRSKHYDFEFMSNFIYLGNKDTNDDNIAVRLKHQLIMLLLLYRIESCVIKYRMPRSY